MVGVVQWLRSPTVTRRMLGSIPAAHPNFCEAVRASRRHRGLGVEGASEAGTHVEPSPDFHERCQRGAFHALRNLRILIALWRGWMIGL